MIKMHVFPHTRPTYGPFLLFLGTVFEVLFHITPCETGFKSGSVFKDIDDVARQTAGQAQRRPQEIQVRKNIMTLDGHTLALTTHHARNGGELEKVISSLSSSANSFSPLQKHPLQMRPISEEVFKIWSYLTIYEGDRVLLFLNSSPIQFASISCI
jgi:hypothetical protein